MAFKPIYKLLDWISEDKLNWNMLSANPNAIQLLEKHPEKINWKRLSKNPDIFKLDAGLMTHQCEPFLNELQAYVFNPDRLINLCGIYNMEL